MDEEKSEICPICKKNTNKMLLHFNKSRKCQEKVSKKQMEEILGNAKRRNIMNMISDAGKKGFSKKKFPSLKVKISQEEIRENARKRKAKEREKLRQEKRKKAKIEWLKAEKEEERTKRKKAFIYMSTWFLVYLSQGRIPATWTTNCFHLVEKRNESPPEIEDPYDWTWVKDIDTAFLEAVLSMKAIVRIPYSKWISAIKILEDNQGNETLKEKVFRLIGKLQAGKNANTMGISIPEKYHSNAATMKWDQGKNAFCTKMLHREEEIMLTDLIADVLGNEEGILNREFQDLLEITEDIENFYDAFAYTTNKDDILQKEID